MFLQNFIKNIKFKIPELIKVFFIIVLFYNIPYFVIFIIYKCCENMNDISVYGFFILMLLIYVAIVVVRFIAMLLMAFVTRNSKNPTIKYLRERNIQIFVLFIFIDCLLYHFIIQPHTIWSILKSNIAMYILLNSLSITYFPLFLIYGILNLLSLRKTNL